MIQDAISDVVSRNGIVHTESKACPKERDRVWTTYKPRKGPSSCSLASMPATLVRTLLILCLSLLFTVYHRYHHAIHKAVHVRSKSLPPPFSSKEERLTISYSSVAFWALQLLRAVLASPECVVLEPDGPLQVTADCVDPIYASPIVTHETDEESPVRHRRVSGSFRNTSVDFNIYLPPKEAWAGRFFQHVYPLQNSTAEDSAIAFGVDSGAYTVRVAGTGGYRADAAAAKFAKEVALRHYDDSSAPRISGYIYGGSGGSFQTIGAMENTQGVWDGGLAMVQAVPISDPNNWTIRALAGLALDGESERIVDAIRPGGSGDPFSGLRPYQKAVLQEATALGVPVSAWEDFDGVARDRTSLYHSLRTMVIPTVKRADPSYADDFWSKDGYLGTEKSALGTVFRERLVEFNSTVEEVYVGDEGVPVGFRLDSVPEGTPTELDFTIRRAGDYVGSFTGLINHGEREVSINSDSNATVLASLVEGIRLEADNHWFLAVHGLHRHQIPPAEAGYYGYEYLRKKNGEPLYPQREVLLAPTLASAASGGASFTGNITAKLFVMDNLGDFDAFPWHADWYKRQVQRALGDQFGDNYRLYFNEHADHYAEPMPQDIQSRLVEYHGLYEQLLRDLSGWVEQGLTPPAPTKYSVQTGQVVMPLTASERAGIQPIVELLVEGANRTTINAGGSVTFNLSAEVPPDAGEIVSLEWDFEGTGEFSKSAFGEPSVRIEAQVSHVYEKTGTYFPVARVAAHRDGNATTAFARALNLGRARVVVN